ncbi:MAG: diphthine--ammonia ligase, partial [Candidatus Woesearchaeota archaeon]
KKDGCRVIFSGLGSEELFAGYERHRNSLDINQECISGLLKMYERDLYRDDVVTMYNGLELRTPFLDTKLVDYSLKIPAGKKLGSEDKLVLRSVARNIGIPEFISGRKKRAAQYGSNFLKGIDKLSRRSGHKTKSSYLSTFYPNRNLRLAALFSSGKDSCYAMHVMMRQNYEISCLVTLQSRNPDSFMFHSPVGLAGLQAEAMGVPIILHETEGEKESELADLRKALEKAKDSHKVDGVVTGALFSNYQRERVEKVCDSLGLKVFHPLWHLNQESEMREIIDAGFRFILVKVAADGLDKSWLGREITHQDVDRLVSLNKKNKINIAFEGGEAESLVLDCPVFKKRILISKAEKLMSSVCDGLLDIKEAVLEGKNEKALEETGKKDRQRSEEV